MSDFSNALIYGKNATERIISCEVHDGYVRLFKLDSELNTCVEDISNRPWILGHKYMGSLGVQLHGNQYYKYGRQFRSIEEWDTARRMCKRFDQFTVHNLKENAMLNKGFTYFKGLTPNEIPILSFDIETVGLELSSKSKVLLISNTFRRGSYIEKRLFAYDEFASDGEMIDEWCKWVREKDPAILLAHNGFTFDLPYLICCAKINGTSLKLGRDGSDIYINDYESQYRIDGSNSLSYAKLFVYGREIVDTLFLAYKYDTATKKYENYKLKYIIEKEGLEKKDRTFYDASQIRYNYTNPEEFSKIKAYCIDDSDDSLALFDLMVPPFFYMGQMIPKPFQEMICSATGSQINALMIRGYLQDKHSIAKADERFDYQGATSLGIPGIYRNAKKVDVASEYPSIQLHYRIYPEHKDPNANLLIFLETMRNMRLYHKQKGIETGLSYHKHMDSSAKIAINSIYGYLGASGLNYNYPKGAAKITEYGRDVINTALLWASSKDTEYWLSKVNGGETDEKTSTE